MVNNIKIYEHGDAAEKAAANGPVITELARNLQKEFFEDGDPEIEGAIERCRGRIKKSLEEGKGQMLFGEVDGALASMLGYLKRGEWKGRTVYEIKSASTLPGFEGQGLYTELRKAAVRQIRALDDDALILTFSSNEKIIRRSEKLMAAGKCEELIADDYHAMMKHAGQMDISLEEFKKELASNPIVASSRLFLYDPKKDD